MNATGLMGLLAGAVERIATTSGDHRTALPELTVHCRNRPRQPVHCIYTLGMALTVQRSKHVVLGDKDLSYGPGQSLLTTMDLPVSYHITRETTTEPYLGIMLKFDRNLITQVASKIEAKRPGKKKALEPIWIQSLDAPVLDALHRLVSLLDEPVLVPQLAALIQQEIIIRLLTGPHAGYLWNIVNAASPTQQSTHAVSWIRQNLAEERPLDHISRYTNKLKASGGTQLASRHLLVPQAFCMSYVARPLTKLVAKSISLRSAHAISPSLIVRTAHLLCVRANLCRQSGRSCC